MYEVEANTRANFFPDHPPFSTLSSTLGRNMCSYVCDYECIVNKEWLGYISDSGTLFLA